MDNSVALAEKERTTFFSGQAGRINNARLAFIKQLLPALVSNLKLPRAIDIGCGPGFFSHELASIGLKTTGLDVREDNVAAASARFSECRFITGDIEKECPKIPPAEIVLAMGLFYHLENPISALRNVSALSSRFLIIESMVAPDSGSVLRMFCEPSGIDQGTHAFALIPSKDVFISTLLSAGFEGIYESSTDIAHYDFRHSPARQQRRHFFLASRDYLGPIATIGEIEFVESAASIPRPPRAAEWNARPLKWARELISLSKSIPNLFNRSAIFWLSHAPAGARVFRRLRHILVHYVIARNPTRTYVASVNSAHYTLRRDDSLEKRLYISGSYERDVTNALRSLFPDNRGTLLDIGAHHGMHSIFAKKALRISRVVCFEPSARERSRLKENIRLNRLANVIVAGSAVSEIVGSTALNIADVEHSGHNSIGSFRYIETSRLHSELVPTISLCEIYDRYAISTDEPVVIKIDVEGHELSVLRSGIPVLRKYHPTLIVEVSHESVGDVRRLLHGIGYACPHPQVDISDTANLIFTFVKT